MYLCLQFLKSFFCFCLTQIKYICLFFIIDAVAIAMSYLFHQTNSDGFK